ncbi:MAG: 4Fe-4S binding protein [Desulfurococcaceae archaeon]
MLIIRVRIEISKEKCNMCGLCVEYCPSSVFTKQQDTIKVDESRCIECYGCIPLCPVNAISIKIINDATLEDFTKP